MASPLGFTPSTHRSSILDDSAALRGSGAVLTGTWLPQLKPRLLVPKAYPTRRVRNCRGRGRQADGWRQKGSLPTPACRSVSAYRPAPWMTTRHGPSRHTGEVEIFAVGADHGAARSARRRRRHADGGGEERQPRPACVPLRASIASVGSKWAMRGVSSCGPIWARGLSGSVPAKPQGAQPRRTTSTVRPPLGNEEAEGEVAILPSRKVHAGKRLALEPSTPRTTVQPSTPGGRWDLAVES